MTPIETEERICVLLEIVCEQLSAATPTWSALEQVATRLLDKYETSNPEINQAVAEAAAVACHSILKESSNRLLALN